MTLTPEQIRSTSFQPARRGYDKAEVDQFLEAVAASLESTRRQLRETLVSLEESRTGEATLRSTLVAMSRAREEILETARNEAAAIVDGASRDADRTVALAEDEAAEIVMDARRAALDVIAEARCDADYLLDVARATAEPLTVRVKELRAVVRRTENLMRGLASGALGDLGQAHLMLDEAPDGATATDPSGGVPEMQIVFSDDHRAHDDDEDDDMVSPLPAAVDRLLSHLREIG